MIAGGNVTLFAADMDRAVRFYTETLGLALRFRAGDHWAEIDAGGGFTIGLHPKDAANPAVPGSIQIGLNLDVPIGEAVEQLASRGVSFIGPVKDDGAVSLAFFKDPDGHVLYLCEVKHT